ncbi:MAG: hypothetical protein ACR652_17355 [Methylocystis sp.]|uniref:hypothetical protein n=1 Tax=Methylocystis sp. TaxID=1911079 RepID=UPI003DA31AF1
MKIEVTQAFYGRPDESVAENTLFLEGAVVDVPDDFGKMVVAKALAKVAPAASPAEKVKPNEAQ